VKNRKSLTFFIAQPVSKHKKKKMKSKLLLAIFLICKISFSQWTDLNLSQDINSTIVLGGDMLYAATENGVYFTDVNTINWQQATDIQDKGLNFYQNGSDVFLTSFEKVYTSTNEGTNWTIFYENQSLNQNVNNIIKDGVNFVLGMDGNGIYFSPDNGQNWFSSDTSWQSKNTSFARVGDILYASYFLGGNMQESNDFGQSWTALPSSNDNGLTFPFSSSYPDIKSLNVLSNDILIAGVNETFDSGSQSGMFFSLNNGESWEKRNTGLTNIFVESVINIGNLILTGTEGGVFYSTDTGNNWNEFNNSLTNLSIKNLNINETSLYASTNNSIFATDICNLLQNSSTISPAGTVDASIGQQVTLTANTGGIAYQWFKDDVEIINANSSTYLPTESGDYKVMISYSSTCSDISNTTSINFETLSILDIEKQPVLKFYPNPTKDLIQFTNLTRTKNYKIFSILGQEVKKGVLKANGEINIQDLEPGLYLLEFDRNSKLKFVKQ